MDLESNLIMFILASCLYNTEGEDDMLPSRWITCLYIRGNKMMDENRGDILTNEENVLCIGINPIGLGLLDMLLHPETPPATPASLGLNPLKDGGDK